MANKDDMLREGTVKKGGVNVLVKHQQRPPPPPPLRPRAEWHWEDYTQQRGIAVAEQEAPAAVLVDARGAPLVRPRPPIGFRPLPPPRRLR